MKSILSALGANKIAIFLGLALFGAGWLGINKISSLSSEVTTLAQTVDTQKKALDKFVEEQKETNRKSNIYFNNTNKTFSELNKRMAQLDVAAGRESTVAAKPGLATKIAKKQVSEYQDRLSCASGNKESCLRLQQSSQPAQPKK